MNKITPEEFKNRMISLSSNEYNEEDEHIDADNLMCDILKEFGYEEGVNVFYKMDKWYS